MKEQYQQYNDEIDLRAYISVLQKRWKIIAYLAFGFALLALIYSSLQKPIYEVTTTIIIRGGSNSGSAYAGLASIMGVSFPGSSSMNDLQAILGSNSVAEKVFYDLKLGERVQEWKNPELSKQKLITALKKALKQPKTEGDNILKLKVEFPDATMAAEIANGYCDALSYFWNKLNITEAKKKKAYIDSQLPRVEKELKDAEEKLKRFTILSPRGIIGAPGLEGARLTREYEIQNTVYVMLRKESESVKLEESKEIPPFSIVDKAVVPEKPIKPRIKLNTLIGLILGGFSGVFLAFFKEYWEKTGS